MRPRIGGSIGRPLQSMRPSEAKGRERGRPLLVAERIAEGLSGKAGLDGETQRIEVARRSSRVCSNTTRWLRMLGRPLLPAHATRSEISRAAARLRRRRLRGLRWDARCARVRAALALSSLDGDEELAKTFDAFQRREVVDVRDVLRLASAVFDAAAPARGLDSCQPSRNPGSGVRKSEERDEVASWAASKPEAARESADVAAAVERLRDGIRGLGDEMRRVPGEGAVPP